MPQAKKETKLARGVVSNTSKRHVLEIIRVLKCFFADFSTFSKKIFPMKGLSSRMQIPLKRVDFRSVLRK